MNTASKVFDKIGVIGLVQNTVPKQIIGIIYTRGNIIQLLANGGVVSL